MNKDLDFSNNYSPDSLANAHWADPSYIADKYVYKSGSIWLGRNPHNPDQAIGYKDDRHVFICAETRSGKGRSFMVNNQVLWPGSLITVGPKGEEATIVAERRDAGNEYCDGMGQRVYVLDPMRSADVPDKLRAHFNLLSGLDADDGELVAKTDRIAKAICTIPDNAGESAEWAKRGQELVATLILHVKTYPYYKDNQRNILTVRDFVQQGQVAGAQILKDKKGIIKNPFELLLEEMIENKACRGVVSRRARDIFESFKDHRPFFNSVRGNAAEHLSFLEGEGISNTVFLISKILIIIFFRVPLILMI